MTVPTRKTEKVTNTRIGIEDDSRIHTNMSNMFKERITPAVTK